MSQEAVADLLDADDPVGSLARIVRTYEEASTSPQRRVRYFFQEPSVRLGRVRGARPGQASGSRRCWPTGGMTPTAGPRSHQRRSCSATSPRWSSGTWTAAPRRSPKYVEDGLRPLRRIWGSGEPGDEVPLGDLADR